jgi:hypothetical protein
MERADAVPDRRHRGVEHRQHEQVPDAATGSVRWVSADLVPARGIRAMAAVVIDPPREFSD